MDSLFDSIIPLLIVLFYLFGSFFRKKTTEEKESTQTEPAYPQPEEESDDLRDEIRRRFQEKAEVFQPELVVEEPPTSVPVHPSVEETLLAQRERHKKIQAEVANVKKGKGTHARIDSMRRDIPSHSLSRSVRTRLNSPLATREAIVLMEVLGTPVGIKQMEEEAGALANS
tara:strand:- start:24588 stop:25100 length:513 start_codon:yes stop_codon:yes gene_type:complete